MDTHVWGFPRIAPGSTSDHLAVKVTTTHGSHSGLLETHLNVSRHQMTTGCLKNDMKDKDTKKASGKKELGEMKAVLKENYETFINILKKVRQYKGTITLGCHF